MTALPRILRGLLIVFCLFAPTRALAFKIDTHLWIAQQVLNDVEDGQITVTLGGRSLTLPVPPDVASAVLAHRNEYLLGHIGPDAIPDIVVGQTLVHPGRSEGWKTNDWLRYLIDRSRGNPLGTAFAYGYLGHAAADVFAHTYVNQYAGDIFELSDETLVEQRHVALESFISRYNPPFLGAGGQGLGNAWQLVQPSDGLASFVRDTLIYDPLPAGEHVRGTYSKHLAAYRAYREVIRSAADQPIWREIDKAVLQAVASYYGYSISPEEAGALIDFMNNEIIPLVQRGIDLNQTQVNRLNAALDRFDAVHYEAIHGALREVIALHSEIAQKLAQRLDAEGKLCWQVTDQICHNVACCIARKPWPLSGCLLEDPLCRRVCQDVARLQCPISEAVGNASADLVRRIDGELNGSNGLFNQLLQSTTRLRDQALIVKNSSLDIGQRLIDLGQVVSNNTSPIKALLDNWRSDLDVAMAAYVKAATSSMINTMNPGARALPQGAITPMVEWFDCYHLTLMGVPAPVGTGSCGFRGSVEAVWQALQNINNIIEDAALLAPGQALGLPSPAQVREQIEQLKSEAIAQLRIAAIDALIDLLPREVQDLIDVLHEDMTDERLRYYFTKPETSGAKGLLMVSDIDQRIKGDMNLAPGDTSYDSEGYAVVHDAIVLAKLALLDGAGLSLLAQHAGLQGELFAGTSNILADAVASIDGNHAWMPVAPPRPNASGAPYRRVELRGYPFASGYASAAGFIPWRAEARDSLFRRLFAGPISPGIDVPAEIGFNEILPADYPYRPCADHPFPDDEHDRRCASSGSAPLRSTTSLSVSSSQVAAGQAVTLTATISGETPVGAVVFFDNGSAIGTLSLVNQTAVLTTAPLAAGAHQFSASYRGDGRNLASSSVGTLAVLVDAPRRAPTADAGIDRLANVGTIVTLTGIGADLDGGALQYAWQQIAGPLVTLQGSATASASFTAPVAGSVLTFEFSVTDETGLRAADQLVVTTRNPIRPPVQPCIRPRPGAPCNPAW